MLGAGRFAGPIGVVARFGFLGSVFGATPDRSGSP
jgi:hypothetical protein